MVNVAKIEILWSECWALSEGAFETWAAVNVAVRHAAASAPPCGGYNKTAFRITWADGETYEGRIDLTRKHAMQCEPVSDHVIRFCSTYSGRVHPDHLSAEEWDASLSAMAVDRAAFATILDAYELTDGAADPVPANDVNACNEAIAAANRARVEAEMAERTRSHWTGSKYQRGRPMRDVAKDIRRELHAASQGGGVLRGVRCSVRLRKATHEHAIEIEITALPEGMPVLNPRRVEADVRRPHGHTRINILSKRGQAIVEAVQNVANAYGYDKSDLHTDYHNRAFYLSVDFSAEVQAAARADIVKALTLTA